MGVRQNAVALESADLTLQGDREFLVAAIERSSGHALKHMAQEFQEDRALIIAAVSKDWRLLKDVTLRQPDLCRDREVVLAAVGHNGCALEHASQTLQADRGVVELALQRSFGAALTYASK